MHTVSSRSEKRTRSAHPIIFLHYNPNLQKKIERIVTKLRILAPHPGKSRFSVEKRIGFRAILFFSVASKKNA
jgi:hypothetical protein